MLEIKAEKMLKIDLFKIIVYPLYVNINNLKNGSVFLKIKFYKDGIGFHFANLLNIWLKRRLWGFSYLIFEWRLWRKFGFNKHMQLEKKWVF